MTDPTNTPAQPLSVNTSPYQAQVGTAMRDVALVVSTVIGVLGFVKTGDLNGLLAYIQNPATIAGIAIIVGGGVVAWRQWRARHDAKVKGVLVANVSDDIAVPK